MKKVVLMLVLLFLLQVVWYVIESGVSVDWLFFVAVSFVLGFKLGRVS